MSDVAAGLERWKLDASEFHIDFAFYMFSPEWERHQEKLWAPYDELENRRQATRKPRLPWQDGAEAERGVLIDCRNRTYRPMDEQQWVFCPLWVHLSRYLRREDQQIDRRRDSWSSLLSDWEEIRYLFCDSPDFRSSLSPEQTRSYHQLEAWWTAAYCDEELITATATYIQKQKVSTWTEDPSEPRWLLKAAPETLTDTSLYHAIFYQLFLLEFHPLFWQPYMAYFRLKELRLVRDRADNFAIIQKIAYATISPTAHNIHQPEPHHQAIHNNKAPQSIAGTENCTTPHFLWDSRNQKTVVTSQLHECPDYVCISHTWGRWRLKTESKVKGVPWLVPENSRFKIQDLASELYRLGFRYIWVDLFCIPQDGSDVADVEINNQASIFRGSSRCIAWIHDIKSWDGVQKALDWWSLRYLRVISTRHTTIIKDKYAEATRAAFAHMELSERMNGREYTVGEPTKWFSSLWALQECVLCPEIEMHCRSWERLEDRRGEAISLRSLVLFIRQIEEYCLLDQPIKTPFCSDMLHQRETKLDPIRKNRAKFKSIAFFPWGARQLLDFNELTRLSDVLRTGLPIAVLINANRRECTSSRAPAIMSAVGVTDWYLPSCSRETEESLVFGIYPLMFLREAARKFGASFYETAYNKTYRGQTDQDLEHMMFKEEYVGTMLPVSKTPGLSSPPMKSFLSMDIARQDHPSVATWTINKNGSVTIPSAGIALTSQDKPRQKIKAYFECATFEKTANNNAVFISEKVDDMIGALKALTGESRCIYAVVLYEDCGFPFGVLLEELSASGHGKGYLVNIGNFKGNSRLRPSSTKVDWVVI